MSLTKRLAALAPALLLAFARPSDSAGQTYVELSGQSIDLRNGGDAARADWLRYKLVELNGPTGGYILASGHGDQRGYLGSINALTSGDALGGVLRGAGIETCEAIPDRGEVTGEVNDDGRTLPARVEFGEGTRTVPAHYEGAGARYARQLVLFVADAPRLEVQLTCADGEGRLQGYFWLPVSDRNDRPKEVYFARDPASGAARVDVAMHHEASGEHYLFRFASGADGTTRIWNIRAMVGSMNSSGFAAAYDPASGLARVSFLVGALAQDDTTSLAAADLACLSLTGAPVGPDACDAGGLNVLPPADSAPWGDAVVPFHIAGAAGARPRAGAPRREREGTGEPAMVLDASALGGLDAAVSEGLDAGLGDGG